MQNFTLIGVTVAEVSVPNKKQQMTYPTKRIQALRLPDNN